MNEWEITYKLVSEDAYVEYSQSSTEVLYVNGKYKSSYWNPFR